MATSPSSSLLLLLLPPPALPPLPLPRRAESGVRSRLDTYVLFMVLCEVVNGGDRCDACGIYIYMYI